MTSMEYLLNCKKFISLMILFSFFDNFGMDAHSTNLKDFCKKLFCSDKERNAKNLKFKVGFVGASGVGKTNIISIFKGKSFNEQHLATVGIDYSIKKVKTNGKDISLLLWDTSGQDRFCNIVCSSFDTFDLIVFVYAVDDNESFEKVKAYFQFYQEKNLKIGTLLVGNKIDLDCSRKVSKEEGKNYANQNKMTFFEVSAKNGTGFKEDFFDPFILKFLVEKNMEEQSLLVDDGHKNNNSISLNTSFCDECCSCCPCLKQSEGLDRG